jgi:hypothetical protein
MKQMIVSFAMCLASALSYAGGQQPNPDRDLTTQTQVQQPNPDRYASSASEANASNSQSDPLHFEVVRQAANQICGEKGLATGPAKNGLNASQEAALTSVLRRLNEVGAATNSEAGQRGVLEKDLGEDLSSDADCKSIVFARIYDFAFPPLPHVPQPASIRPKGLPAPGASASHSVPQIPPHAPAAPD